MKEISNQLLNGNITFFIFCIITIGGALYVLFSKNILYATYGILISFLGVAGIFVFAGGEFVAASQIMIYIGGILVLLIFGIMLSSNKKEGKHYLKIENMDQIMMVVILVSLVVLLTILSISTKFDLTNNKPTQHIKNLGFNLMTESVLPLEMIGILLLMALIGATFIAKNDE